MHRQIRSNEAQHEANRKAERQSAKRAELLEATRQTLELMTRLSSSLISLHNNRRLLVLHGEEGAGEGWDLLEYRKIEASLTAQWSMFHALGFENTAGELSGLLDVTNAYVTLRD